MFRALVFDFDGLVLETEGPSLESWIEIYREHGLEVPLQRWHDDIGSHGCFASQLNSEVLTNLVHAQAVPETVGP